MKKPTRNDTINLRIMQGDKKKITIENIVGVFDYPVVVHRRISDHEQIQEGLRKRYTSSWAVTHIPSGMSFGLVGNWETVRGFATEIKDHPTLLMHDEKQMRSHPQYQELVELHRELRAKWA